MADRKYQHNARVRCAWVIICRYDSREKSGSGLDVLAQSRGRRGCTNQLLDVTDSVAGVQVLEFDFLRSSVRFGPSLEEAERPVLKLMRNCSKKMNFVPDRRRHMQGTGVQ